MKKTWIWIVVIVIILAGALWYAKSSGIWPSNPAAAVTAIKPVVVTNASAVFSKTGVTVSGSVGSGGAPTTYWFEYGTTLNFGMSTPAASSGNNTTLVPETAVLTGLTKNTTYYFRLGAKNKYGTTYGGVYNFVAH